MQTVAQQRESRPYLSFDRYQFSHRPKISSINSELAYGDIRGIHLLSKKSTRCRHYIGAWATNPRQLQKVILTRGWHFVHGGRSTMPSGMTWPVLKKLCDEKFAMRSKEVRGRPPVNGVDGDTEYWQWQRFTKQTVPLCGGYLEYISALAYRSLVLGYESPIIAQQMEITAVNVRTQIFNLNKIATKLGFETHRQHHSKGRTPIDDGRQPVPLPENFRSGNKIVWSPEFMNWLGRMREQGFRWSEIAVSLGVSTGAVQSYYVRRKRIISNPLRRSKSMAPRIKPPRKSLLWTPDLVCEICELRERNWTWKQIGQKFGRSPVTMLLGFRRVTTGSPVKQKGPVT